MTGCVNLPRCGVYMGEVWECDSDVEKISVGLWMPG